MREKVSWLCLNIFVPNGLIRLPKSTNFISTGHLTITDLKWENFTQINFLSQREVWGGLGFLRPTHNTASVTNYSKYVRSTAFWCYLVWGLGLPLDICSLWCQHDSRGNIDRSVPKVILCTSIGNALACYLYLHWPWNTDSKDRGQGT